LARPFKKVIQRSVTNPETTALILERLPEAARRLECARLVSAVASEADQKAFAALFDFYAPRLKAFCRKRGCDDRQAEELVQEIMLTLWRKAASYDVEQGSVSTWLFRIARNRHIDLIRKNSRRVIDEEDPSFQPEASPLPDELVGSREREDQVRGALSTLPDRQREILHLAFFEGLTHSQIADRIAIPMGTVKSRLRLAFEKLRSLLED
jgi:RNA polymerase sigma factor (sigma-70 family)